MKKDHDIFGAAVVFQGGMVLVALAVGSWVTPRPQDRIEWTAAGALWGVAATIPMLIAFAATRTLPFRPLEDLKRFVDEVLVELFRACTLPQLATISLLAGLGEELLFRGLLQPWVSEQAGTVIGLVVASLLFGLLHAVSTAYAVLATLIGVYLGWLLLATGNLLPAIIAHALYDFLVLTYLVRRPQVSAVAD